MRVESASAVRMQCDAVNGNVASETWKVRCSFPVYLIAMAATAGAHAYFFIPLMPCTTLLCLIMCGMELCLQFSSCRSLKAQ
jgi:hypothetical protein